VSRNNVGVLTAVPISESSYVTSSITTKYNNQAFSNIKFICKQRNLLNESNDLYLKEIYAKNDNPTVREIRNLKDWSNVKKIVIRKELMKLQMGGKTNLQLTDSQADELKKIIVDKDLSDLNDKQINELINNIVKPDKQTYLKVLRDFKENGIVSDSLRKDKLRELREELKNMDLTKINNKELKRLVNNYIEKNEFHHRISVKADPYQQNDINNIDAVPSSKHQEKHRDPVSGKVNYRKALNERPIDCEGELKTLNRKRVFKNELRGLGLVAAIGAGIGMTLGFVSTLAQMGITPDSLKYALAEGIKSSTESGFLSVVGYGVGRTIGEVATNALTGVINNLGVNITQNLSKIISMGSVGTLSIMTFSVYQFIKLKIKGVATKEALIQTGKQTLFSLSLLAASMAAQGIFGGSAGIITSVGVGLIMISYSIANSIHQRYLAEEILVYTINKYYPVYLVSG